MRDRFTRARGIIGNLAAIALMVGALILMTAGISVALIWIFG